jgi:hypothetical protein
MSPIEGAPSGLHLHLGAEGSARAQVRLGGGAVDPGAYVVAEKVADEAAQAVRLSFADSGYDLGPGPPTEIEVRLVHAGGPLELEVALAGSPGASIWLAEARIAAFDSVTQ